MKMKRVLTVTLIIAMIAIVFTGCSSNEAPVDENKPAEDVQVDGDLTDGTYLIKREVSDNGNFAMATLEVAEGEIANFEYNEYLVDSGEAKNDSNYAYAEGIAVIKDLNEQFNEKKDIEAVDFDAVSGATHTKGDFKDIVNELLEKASKGETYEPVYEDGIYEAKADEDSKGWLSQVSVNIKDGQIVGVDYAELAIEDSEDVKEGDRKSEDNYEYLAPFEVAEGLQKQIIDNNGTEDLDLDSLTGATGTRSIMVELVDEALSTAK